MKDIQKEKIYRELDAFMQQNGAEHKEGEELNDLQQTFIKQHNASPFRNMTAASAESAEDYVELAEDARSAKEALRYAQKALTLDPDNLDAERIAIDASAKEPWELIARLEQAVKHGTKVMEARGFMDKESIGNYWGLFETRPYMRLRDKFVISLTQSGMMRRAAAECEEMLRLCTNDNLGERYTLMHIYAFLEDEKAALALHKKYDGHEETQMLLPLSVMYYKLFQLDKAREYLDRLAEANKDTKKFFRAVRQNKLNEYADEMGNLGYRPYTIEELIVDFMDYTFLFTAIPEYLHWADRELNGRKK